MSLVKNSEQIAVALNKVMQMQIRNKTNQGGRTQTLPVFPEWDKSVGLSVTEHDFDVGYDTKTLPFHSRAL